MEDAEIVALIPMVHRLASRLIGRGAPSRLREDLEGAGTLALVEASQRYDPNRGAPFTSYAYQRIQGAMLDEMRSHDTVSRAERAQMRAANETRNVLPGSVELMAESGWEMADPAPNPADVAVQDDLVERLDAAVEELPPRHRDVARGMLGEVPTRVIAADLKVTQSRISQMGRDVVRRLREAFDVRPDAPIPRIQLLERARVSRSVRSVR